MDGCPSEHPSASDPDPNKALDRLKPYPPKVREDLMDGLMGMSAQPNPWIFHGLDWAKTNGLGGLVDPCTSLLKTI